MSYIKIDTIWAKQICSYSCKKYGKFEKYFDLKGNIFRVKSTSVSNIHLFYIPCQVNFSIKYSSVLYSVSSQLQYQIFTCSMFHVKSTSVSNIHLFSIPCHVNFSIKYSPVLCSVSSELQYQIFTYSMFRVKSTSVLNIHLFYIPCQVNFSIKYSPVLCSMSSQLQYQIFTCSIFHVKSTSVSKQQTSDDMLHVSSTQSPVCVPSGALE